MISTNIISRTYKQLCTIESLMKKDIKDQLATINYFVFENEYKLINYNEIEIYLTHNKIENPQLFKEICKRCLSIIEMWNSDFKDLKYRTSLKNNDYEYAHVLELKDDDPIIHKYQNKKKFIENNQCNIYQISAIAQKCSLLNNKITAFLPQLIDITTQRIEKKNKFFIEKNILDEYLQEHIKVYSYTNLKFDVNDKTIWVKNNFIAFILDIIYNEYDFEIKVKPTDKTINPDKEYKENALLNLEKIFIKGNTDGLKYFENELKPIYKQMLINDSDNLIRNFIDDYFEKRFLISKDRRITLKEFETENSIIFNEQLFYNYGYLNGIYNGFDDFIMNNTTLEKAIKERYKKNEKTTIAKKQIKFEDFFINTASEQKTKIKENFKDLKGKKLACFISLCYNDFKVLTIEPNAKDGLSCKNLIEFFKQNNTYQSVNKYLDGNYKYNQNADDLDTIKKQLNAILK